MKIKSNLVSLLAGGALGTLAVLNIAATSTDYAAGGRFQLLATDRFVFKIDTSTGQVWRSYVDGPSKEFLQPVIKTPEAASSKAMTPNTEKNPEK